MAGRSLRSSPADGKPQRMRRIAESWRCGAVPSICKCAESLNLRNRPPETTARTNETRRWAVPEYAHDAGVRSAAPAPPPPRARRRTTTQFLAGTGAGALASTNGGAAGLTPPDVASSAGCYGRQRAGRTVGRRFGADPHQPRRASRVSSSARAGTRGTHSSTRRAGSPQAARFRTRAATGPPAARR